MSDCYGVVEVDWLVQFECVFGVGLGIQWFDVWFVDLVVLVVFLFGVFFLDVCGVQQYEFQQFVGGFGGEDWVFEVFGCQVWQQVVVVQVGVGDDYCVDVCGIEGEGCVVVVVGFVVFLVYVVFEQDFYVIEGFQQIIGVSDFLGGVQKCQ